MPALADHGGLMDRVYRRQRHVYDATRKYYLLGRDPMLAGLATPPGGSILEIGCGTGRNLIKAASLYPSSPIYGVDISRAMLVTAEKSVAAAGFDQRIRLAVADAAQFDPARSFGRGSFDRVFISYAVSMIPDWRAAMRSAVAALAPGGVLSVVDFGDLAGLPAWTKAGLYRWLESFHVTPRTELFSFATELAREIGGASEARVLYRGYAWIATVRRPG